MTPIFYSFSKRYTYDPETGEMLDGVEPVTALWRAGRSNSNSLRVRLGRNADHGDVTMKAEILAMMFITGGELPDNTSVGTVDGDPQNLKASNLYAYREDPALKRPGQTTPGRELIVHTSQAAALWNIFTPGDVATQSAQAYRITGALCGSGPSDRCAVFDDPLEGLRVDYILWECAQLPQMLSVPEYIAEHGFNAARYSAWLNARVPALKARIESANSDEERKALFEGRYFLERMTANVNAAENIEAQRAFPTLPPGWKEQFDIDARSITPPELFAERDALLERLAALPAKEAAYDALPPREVLDLDALPFIL